MGHVRTRFAAVTVLAVAMVAGGVAQPGRAVATASSPVTNAFQGPSHNAVGGALGQHPSRAWQRALPGRAGTPLEKDGRVFVTATNTLYALSAADGTTLWAVDLGDHVRSSRDVDTLAFSDVHMVVDGNTVVTAGRPDGLLVAYDVRTGLVRWEVSPVVKPGSGYSQVVAPGNGLVYATEDERVEARQALTGRRVWKAPATGARLSFGEHRLYTGAGGACSTQALDPATGHRLWLAESSCPESRAGTAYDVVAGGRLYDVSGGVLSTAAGTRAGTWTGERPPVLTDSRTVTMADGSLTARDTSTGDVSWTLDGNGDGDGRLVSAPVVAGDAVAVEDSSGSVRVLDLESGRPTSTLSLPSHPDAFDVMSVADGQLLAPSTHFLTAFRAGPFAGPRPAAADPVRVSLPDRRVSRDVTNYLGNASHDNVTGSSALARRAHLAWTRGFRGQVSAPLLTATHVVVTLAPTAGGDVASRGSVVALSPTTGRVQWQVRLPDEWPASAVLVGSKVVLLTSGGLTMSIDLDTGRASKPLQLIRSQAPLTTDGRTLYLESAYNTVLALPLTKATKPWAVQVDAGHTGAPAVLGSRVVFNGPCSTGAVDRSSGKPLWVVARGCSGGGGVTAVAHAGLVFGMDDDEPNRQLDVRTGLAAPAFSGDREPVAAGSLLFTVSLGVLRAEDIRTHRVLWTRDSHFALPPLVVGGRVVDVTESGTVVVMSGLTGHVAWRDSRHLPAGGTGYESVQPPAAEAAHGTLAVPVGNQLVVYRSDG